MLDDPTWQAQVYIDVLLGMTSRGIVLVAEEGAAKGDALDRYNSYTITLTYLSSQHYFLSSHYMTE